MRMSLSLRRIAASTSMALAVCGVGWAAEGPAPLAGMRPYLVAISVRSLEQSVAWYEKVLDLHLVEKKAFPDQGLAIAFLESEGFRLELIELRGSVGRAGCVKDPSNPATLQGIGKYAFVVDHLDEVATTLVQRGAKIYFDTRKDPEPSERSVIIQDNDGNWIQFFQRPG
jgi:catechol 2,3-dioxygenase-like lactoylglutathione lyase family enzyme